MAEAVEVTYNNKNFIITYREFMASHPNNHAHFTAFRKIAWLSVCDAYKFNSTLSR